MKIRIQRHSFLKQFLTASQAAAVRDVKPVLMNILLKADKTGTFFMATDMDVGLKLPVTEIDVLKPGCVMLPVKQVRAILTESHDETLEITVKKDNVTIRGAKSSFVLPTQNTEEFPEIREPDEGDHVTVDAEEFLAIVPRTIFATDELNTKYSLGGVFLECDGKHLHCVSTDGRRLAHTFCDVNDAPKLSAIVPPKTLAMVSKVFGDVETVRILVNGTLIWFLSNDIILFSRMVEGRYPRWRIIIPAGEKAIEVKLQRTELLTAVRQSAIVATEKQPGVDFVFRPGELELRGEGSETGESNVKLPIEYDAAEFTVRLDPKFVVDFLRCLDAKDGVTVRLYEDQPVHFLASGNYEYVVMPISS